MKEVALLGLLIVGGLLAWLFGSRLSTDALGMAVGLVFGVLAGVPTALLVLASSRQRPVEDDGGYQPVVQQPSSPPQLGARSTAPVPQLRVIYPWAFEREGGRWDSSAYLESGKVETLNNIPGGAAHVRHLGDSSIGVNGIYKIEAYRDGLLVAVWSMEGGEPPQLPSGHAGSNPLIVRQHLANGEWVNTVAGRDEVRGLIRQVAADPESTAVDVYTDGIWNRAWERPTRPSLSGPNLPAVDNRPFSRRDWINEW